MCRDISPRCCKCVKKIKRVSSDYTIQLKDESILVDTTIQSITITVPLASSYPKSREMRYYTIMKNSTSDNPVIVKLSGIDQWYLNRGYNTKMIRGMAK